MTQSKFNQLGDWLPLIISDIKKDIKIELIKFDHKLYQKIFSRLYVAKLSSKELADSLKPELEAGNPELEEWMIGRWIYRHAEIYQFFVDALSVINPDFEQIKDIEQGYGQKITSEAIRRFGAPRSYLFSILNGVAFDASTLEGLAQQAENDRR